MVKFLLRRTGYGLLIIIGVITVVFFLFHALPGDPVSMMAGQRSDLNTRENIAKELGLDKPILLQFFQYVNDLSPLSLHTNTAYNSNKYEYTPLLEMGQNILVIKKPYMRRSFQTNKRVDDIIIENIGATFWLALAALVLASIIGITLGVIAAIKQHTFWDHAIISTSVLGISIPSFVAAIVIALIFGYYLSDYTGLNLTGQLWQTHPIYGKQLHLENIILPAITLSLRPLAIIVQLTRSAMIDVLAQDYIRTARSKGLSVPIVLFKHALRNALNPVITAVTGWAASLMAGAFFVEYIFDWKGIGFVTIKAVQSLDFPVVMGTTLFIASIFILINIMVDLLYAVTDPRVRIN